MRVLVTGASGKLGKQIVPRLAASGVECVVVGRIAERLRQYFPARNTYSYDQILDAMIGCDAVLHLAAVNNNSGESEEAFHRGNVEFTPVSYTHLTLPTNREV